MLKNIRIQNFKSWKDTGVIELAPVTVLFGNNSSGKSSIGQFLVMLKQTVQQSDRKTVLMLNGTQASVDLGGVSDIMYRHSLSENLEFSYTWDLDKKSEIEGSLSGQKYNKIQFEDAVNVNERNVFEVTQFVYHLYDGEEQKLSVGMQKISDKDENRKYDLFSEGMEFKRTRGRAWKLTEPVKYYGFSDAALSYYQNSDFLQDLNLHQEELFADFYYLGPMRTKTKRIYTWSGVNPDSVGDNGEYTIPAILSAKNNERKLKFKNTNYKSFEEVISESLKRMGLVEDYKIEKLENRQDYEVKVRIKGAQEYVSLPDVGFGVSQVLPVIVQLFYAPCNSIIFIEQPEIHLHPSAQSLLADVILDAVNMRENKKDRNIQVIIETHSEHLLRRLQRRISEKKVSKNEIKAYFAENTGNVSKLEKLNVDEYGNILNWPEGFFGDMEQDMYEQSINAVNRRIAERDEKSV